MIKILLPSFLSPATENVHFCSWDWIHIWLKCSICRWTNIFSINFIGSQSSRPMQGNLFSIHEWTHSLASGNILSEISTTPRIKPSARPVGRRYGRRGERRDADEGRPTPTAPPTGAGERAAAGETATATRSFSSRPRLRAANGGREAGTGAGGCDGAGGCSRAHSGSGGRELVTCGATRVASTKNTEKKSIQGSPICYKRTKMISRNISEQHFTF